MNGKQLKFYLLKQGYLPTYVLALTAEFKRFDAFVRGLQAHLRR